MQKKKKETVESNINEKIQYLGLNFERVPKSLIATDNIEFDTLKGYDEKQYKQYKFIKISDIDILLTPKHRMDDLRERFDVASPLYMYLDSKSEENSEKYSTFLKLLKKIEISDVEKIAIEQEKLSKKIPFKVKFNGNYLWQIYYSESYGRYVMLVPTEDSDYSTFFYLLKKKIENKKNDTIFVPISYLDYNGKILKKSELNEIENYLWLFTKDYPSIYEVTDKNENETLQIIGETPIYENIKTLYKMEFNTSKDANKYFKLLKALFILQVQLPHYYNFNTNIDEEGKLELYLDDEKIKYENLVEFVSKQYVKSIELKQKTKEEIESLNSKLKSLKEESIKLEKEYLEKEKNISTFLECKKTFFGKVKYYFTMGKKSKNIKNSKKRESIKNQKVEEEHKAQEENIKIEKRNYTLDELIVSFKDLELIENNKKNTVQDINALKLKNKNLTKKIENATSYINEINKHKKSIFEFWKYSNKDEVATLEEGEEEEVNVSKVEKVFNFKEDFEEFAEKVDKVQRLKFTDQELESCYIASTELFEFIKDISGKKTIELQEYSEKLKSLKEEKDELLDEENEDFDVFGTISHDNSKERTLGNKTHRETPRDKFKVLEIKKGMKGQDFRKAINDASKSIAKALKKNTLEDEIFVYVASSKEINFDGLQKFSLDEDSTLKAFFKKDSNINKIHLYRLKLPIGTNFIAFSNIILYNNRNMTLPVGMNESSEILLDANDLEMKVTETKDLNIKYLKDEKDDFSDMVLKTIQLCEIECKKK